MCPTVPGPVRVYIEAPVGRYRDIDNMIKPLLDLLGSGKHGMSVIEDDSMVDDLRIVRVADPGTKVTISIWPIRTCGGRPGDIA